MRKSHFNAQFFNVDGAQNQ